MTAWMIGLLVFACVYGGALLGFALRVPEKHRDSDSREVLKVSTGLVGTMAALVLGLLVASAKSSYDNQRDELIQVCADVSLLDRVLANFGPEADDTRAQLKSTIEGAFSQLWSRNPEPPTRAGEAFYASMNRLQPKTDQERAIKAMAMDLAISIGKTRWLLHAQNASAISTPLLVIVVFWLTILFIGFGVYVQPNATVRIALFVCALSVAAAIFLILEMDRPFGGIIRIPEAPLRDVVSRIGK
jgi:hypothetical protein